MGNAEKLGWSFFVLGSLVFTAAGIVNGDWWTFVGGLLLSLIHISEPTRP